VHALRETETGFPPGAHFYYSNVGFRALGFLLETLTGQSYADAIRTRLLEPLGMKASDSVITHETRRRLAVGYQRLYDDRPSHPTHPLIPATWLETGTGDGCLACTAADLATYLRALLNRGRGLISEDSFKLMTARVVEEDEPGWFYGYGLGTFELDGCACLGHGGDMPGYSAGMQGDLDTGVGVCVLVNQSQVFGITSHLLTLFRAALRGKELPPLPPLARPTHIENAADYAGTYRAGEGQSRGIAPTLTLSTQGRQLILEHGGERLPLEARGEDTFFVNYPDFALFLLRFGRTDGVVVEAAHGPSWYVH
jgi:CubicO group peptidase (beta-lactamase class C family)